LYRSGTQIVAELNASNQVVSQFVYSGGRNVPDYMIQGATKYRILTDQLGSVRLVVQNDNGAVKQRIGYGYDSCGNVLSDSSPGFQPFGFAGGLYDRDTKLIRFGARDYDPEVGRWISKDPALFEGGTRTCMPIVMAIL
jgi:RHS repeat-associated protein